jgi:hypothetical protein
MLPEQSHGTEKYDDDDRDDGDTQSAHVGGATRGL